MSEENVAVVQQAFKALNENDFEGWFATSSAEIKVYPRAEEPGVRLVNWYSGWEDYTVEPERFINAGEWVVVDAREVGLAEKSGCASRKTSPMHSNFRTGRPSNGGCSVRSRRHLKP